VLVLNAEPWTRDALRSALTLEGFEVVVARDEDEALRLVEGEAPDAAIVDLAAVGDNGEVVSHRLRQAQPRLPVLVIGDEARPLGLVELLTRLRVLIRRRESGEAGVMRFADLELDPARYEVARSGRSVDVTMTEFSLLELFLERPREVLSRAELFNGVWGYDFGTSSNALNVHIGRLRRKLEAGGEPRLIHAVRGVGYVLREP
jgi:two-component system, OmpR family, response regulator MprA